MWKTKLCLNVSTRGDFEKRLENLKNARFDGFFVGWEKGTDLKKIKAKADSLGLLFQSVHAPFSRVNLLWTDTEESKEVLEELITCIRETKEIGVTVLVAHAFIGFEDHTPTEAGIKNFKKVFEEAERLGVTIALENTEGEEYLDALMNAFWDSPALGFCIDTGHEMCYNHSNDMLGKYAAKLVATHINDNLGISNFNGEISYLDDLHLQPFDGVGDFDYIVDRLNKYGYNGPLTFELNQKSKPERHDNDRYSSLSEEEFFALCYSSACRVAALKEKRKQKIQP